MSIEDDSKDLDDDVEFSNLMEEEDIFESDFESTDEEAAQAEVVTGEKEVQDEERQVRKQAKSKLEKVTAAADARLRVTFNPAAAISDRAYQKSKPKRRVSLGLTINAETGEVIATDGTTAVEGEEGNVTSSQMKIRHSQRRHTMQNTVETVKRLKSSEMKKAATPKKAKVSKKRLTQGELIAKALDNEEGNLVEHRNYLRLEEEKRKRARVTKTAISGPLVRWVSRREEVKVKVIVQPPAPAPPPSTAGSSSHPLTSYQNLTTFGYPYSYAYRPSSAYSDYLRFHQAYSQGLYAKSSSGITGDTQAQSSASQQQAASAIAQLASTSVSTQSPAATAPPSTSASPAPTFTTQQVAAVPQSQQPQPIEKVETVAKNYVVHELAQHDGIRKANWTETMKAMFGQHVRWDEVKVYTGKGRPMSRPKHICPITGKQAMYLDPRTGVPYADVRAFKILTDLLEHEYIWNAELGCYVGKTVKDVDMDVG
ncbi:hypothetical protein AX14_000885 [Amanita brunnescens Koide BX004]|nr:hypothetical protein AX14_000885 [Amanita brunnescens Koide BX004]